jgi:hypothetical protein
VPPFSTKRSAPQSRTPFYPESIPLHRGANLPRPFARQERFIGAKNPENFCEPFLINDHAHIRVSSGPLFYPWAENIFEQAIFTRWSASPGPSIWNGRPRRPLTEKSKRLSQPRRVGFTLPLERPWGKAPKGSKTRLMVGKKVGNQFKRKE